MTKASSLALSLLAGGSLLATAPAAAQSRQFIDVQGCGLSTYARTPEQVLEDHRAALAAGDLDAVYCNYSPDAVVVGDGGIDQGHEEIRASLEFFLQIFGGEQPVVVQQISVQALDRFTHVVRLLFTIDTACVSVPDGIDTYVIRFGQIHAQTSHGFPVFHCLP